MSKITGSYIRNILKKNPNLFIIFHSPYLWKKNFEDIKDYLNDIANKYNYELILINIDNSENFDIELLNAFQVSTLPVLFIVKNYIIKEILINEDKILKLENILKENNNFD